MDLNYTRDTTSGREGLELLDRVRAFDAEAAGRRHDRLGQHRHGRGRHAPRRAQLRPEAVGRHDAGRKSSAGDRRRPAGAAPRREAAARARRSAAHPARAPAGELPGTSSFGIAGAWTPASGFGGDCYDALTFGAACRAVHRRRCRQGLPAALLMSNLQAACARSRRTRRGRTICASVNRLLCLNMTSGRFVVLLPAARRGRDACSRTPTPATTRRCSCAPMAGSTSCREARSWGSSRTPATTSGAAARRGDRLLFYTDGITEALATGQEKSSATNVSPPCSSSIARSTRTRCTKRSSIASTAFATDGFQDDATLIAVEVR